MRKFERDSSDDNPTVSFWFCWMWNNNEKNSGNEADSSNKNGQEKETYHIDLTLTKVVLLHMFWEQVSRI